MNKLLKATGTCFIAASLMTGGPLFAGSHEGGHSGHKMQMGAMSKDAVSATGEIKEIVTSANKIKVYHEPIKAWKMGAMQMTFELADGIDINSLKQGQKIHFMVKSPSTGKYLITKIMK